MWLKSGREKDSVGYLVLFFSSSTMSCSLSSLLSLLTDSTLSPRASARAASVYPRPLVRTILALKYETEPYQWQPELTGYESFIAEKQPCRPLHGQTGLTGLDRFRSPSSQNGSLTANSRSESTKVVTDPKSSKPAKVKTTFKTTKFLAKIVKFVPLNQQLNLLVSMHDKYISPYRNAHLASAICGPTSTVGPSGLLMFRKKKSLKNPKFHNKPKNSNKKKVKNGQKIRKSQKISKNLKIHVFSFFFGFFLTKKKKKNRRGRPC